MPTEHSKKCGFEQDVISIQKFLTVDINVKKLGQ